MEFRLRFSARQYIYLYTTPSPRQLPSQDLYHSLTKVNGVYRTLLLIATPNIGSMLLGSDLAFSNAPPFLRATIRPPQVWLLIATVKSTIIESSGLEKKIISR